MASSAEQRTSCNPARSAWDGLTRALRERRVNAGPVISNSPTSMSNLEASRPRLLQELQRVSKRGQSSRAAAVTPLMMSRGEEEVDDDARRGMGVKKRNENCSAAEALLVPKRLPTAQSTTAAAAPCLRGAKTLPVKKRRIRPSKKKPTEIIFVEKAKFRETVERVTGGTFCSHTSATVSFIVSTPSVISDSVDVLLSPQPQSRSNEHGTSGDDAGRAAGSELPAGVVVPPMVGTPAVSQEQPDLFAMLFQGSDCSGNLNDMMGYTNQTSWLAMESTFSGSESIGAASSKTQFAGVYPSETTIGTPIHTKHLSDGSELCNGGGPYQGDAPSAAECPKLAGKRDVPQGYLPLEEENDVNIDSWFRY